MAISFLWRYAFKDLRRQKVRTILGVGGVAVSIFLLTTVSFLTDSISNSFVDLLTTESGNQDIVITARHYPGEPENYSTYFDPMGPINQLKANVSEIGDFISRWEVSSSIMVKGSDTSEDGARYLRSTFDAIDPLSEQQNGFGSFTEITGEYTNGAGIPLNSCIVSEEFLKSSNYQIGDDVEVYIESLNSTFNLTILASTVPFLKFKAWPEQHIIVDIDWFPAFIDQLTNRTGDAKLEGKVNKLICTFANPENFYDIKDVEGSETLIIELGEKIHYTIGLLEWNIEFPKMENLNYSEYLTMTLQVIFIFIALIAMLIAGILINGILSTSVEERIREDGINRVLGAHNKHNIELIIIQGLMICVVGSTVGIFSSA